MRYRKYGKRATEYGATCSRGERERERGAELS